MEYYDNIASGYNELHYEEQMKKFRIISNCLKVQSHESLLDIGCGPGFSQEIFNCKIMGLEPSHEMLIQGKKERVTKMNFVLGKGEHIPFKDSTFDFIICVTALHNFKDPEKGLAEIKRVGKGKGAITILKKARHANELKDSVNEIFQIEKEIEEDRDIILFFDLGKL